MAQVVSQKRVTQISILFICVLAAFGLTASINDATSFTRDVIRQLALPCVFSVLAIILLKKNLTPRLLKPIRITPYALLIGLATVTTLLFGLQNSLFKETQCSRSKLKIVNSSAMRS